MAKNTKILIGVVVAALVVGGLAFTFQGEQGTGFGFKKFSPTGQVRPVSITCTEDDRGSNPYSSSATRGIGGIKKDTCVSDRVLKEYYCSGSYVRSANIVCPNGYSCRFGECTELPKISDLRFPVQPVPSSSTPTPSSSTPSPATDTAHACTLMDGVQSNRAKAVKLVVEELVRDGAVTLVTNSTPTFSDVPASHWAFQYVETAVANGWILGNPDGLFAPSSLMMRAEFANFVTRAFALNNHSYERGAPHFTDVENGDWYATAVHTLYDVAAIEINFCPRQPATTEFIQNVVENMPNI